STPLSVLIVPLPFLRSPVQTALAERFMMPFLQTHCEWRLITKSLPPRKPKQAFENRVAKKPLIFLVGGRRREARFCQVFPSRGYPPELHCQPRRPPHSPSSR